MVLTTAPFDELMDIAHRSGFCGCSKCPRAGLQWGRTKDRQAFWVAAVLPGEKPGTTKRVECHGESLDWAARELIWTQLVHDPVAGLDVKGKR